MRYYWEALFSSEYFPYWEFTMLMMLALNISILWRLHRIEKKIFTYQDCLDLMFKYEDIELLPRLELLEAQIFKHENTNTEEE
jgi:hypothetical protein